jgi:dipeptidase E
MDGRIFVGGGGSESDEAHLWDELFMGGQRVTVWPYAQPRARWPAVERWLTSALMPRGDFHVETPPETVEGLKSVLHDADVLAIPGGNTFELLTYLRRHDLLTAMSSFLARGGRLYGGSAGAIVLGADISIAELMDDNAVGIKDTRGADLLSGSVVYPHFSLRHEATVRQWAVTHGATVLGVPETAGLVVQNTTARNTGPGPIQVFHAGGQRNYEAGSSWPLGEP